MRECSDQKQSEPHTRTSVIVPDLKEIFSANLRKTAFPGEELS